MNPESIPDRQSFRFTLWDILAFTTLVAAMFAAPLAVVQTAGVSAILIVILSAALLILPVITSRKRAGRPAKVERALIRLLIRSLIYASLIVGLAGLVMLGQIVKLQAN